MSAAGGESRKTMHFVKTQVSKTLHFVVNELIKNHAFRDFVH